MIKATREAEHRPQLTDFLACADFGDDEILRLIASAERVLEHPLAAALVEAARERGLELSKPSSFEYAPGQGIHATVDGHDVWVGNLAYTKERGWQEAPQATLDRYAGEGKTPLLAAIDGKPGAILALADGPRVSAQRQGGARADARVASTRETSDRTGQEVPDMAKILDPVCDMVVDVEEQRERGLTTEHDGKTYAFCAPGCKRSFEKEPAKYTAKVAQWQASAH